MLTHHTDSTRHRPGRGRKRAYNAFGHHSTCPKLRAQVLLTATTHPPLRANYARTVDAVLGGTWKPEGVGWHEGRHDPPAPLNPAISGRRAGHGQELRGTSPPAACIPSPARC